MDNYEPLVIGMTKLCSSQMLVALINQMIGCEDCDALTNRESNEMAMFRSQLSIAAPQEAQAAHEA